MRVLVVADVLGVWRHLDVIVVIVALLHGCVAVIGSAFLAEEFVLIAQDIHFYHVVLLQVGDLIIERLDLHHLNAVLVLFSLFLLLLHFFAILLHLVELILQGLNLRILILALSLQILAHVFELFDGAVELPEDSFLFILLQVLLFLDFLLALVDVLLELVQKLGELHLEVLVLFGQCDLLVVELFLFVLNEFHALLDVVVDLELLVQSGVFVLLEGLLLLDYLVGDQNRRNLTLSHLLNLEKASHLVRVRHSSLILLVGSFSTFLAKTATTLASQWHLRILEHFEIVLVQFLLCVLIIVHKRHVVQNLIHVKI